MIQRYFFNFTKKKIDGRGEIKMCSYYIISILYCINSWVRDQETRVLTRTLRDQYDIIIIGK